MSNYNPLSRVDFIPQNYDTLIRQKGMRVKWQQAMMCPCMHDTGQPNFNCTLCSGTGFIYSPAKDTFVVSTTLNGNREFANVGVRETGTAYITALSTDLMGYHDRLTFVDFSSKYSQVVSFKNGKSLPLSHRCKKLLLAQDSTTQFCPDLDFTVINDGWNLELNGKLKEVYGNSNVAVLYVTSPAYDIIDICHELRATMLKGDKFAELPKQFLIKREDFEYHGHQS